MIRPLILAGALGTLAWSLPMVAAAAQYPSLMGSMALFDSNLLADLDDGFQRINSDVDMSVSFEGDRAIADDVKNGHLIDVVLVRASTADEMGSAIEHRIGVFVAKDGTEFDAAASRHAQYPSAANLFVVWLRTDAAKAIIRSHGFNPR